MPFMKYWTHDGPFFRIGWNNEGWNGIAHKKRHYSFNLSDEKKTQNW